MMAWLCRIVLCLCLLFGWAMIAGAQEARRLPEVVVTGAVEQVTAPLGPARAELARDSAELLWNIPGAATVRNGPLTGIVQLRGLFGDRVKVVVDGAEPTPACPNHMDPPLHYLAPSALNSLMVLPGITPVSLGGDSIAGTVVAETAPPRFAKGRRPEMFGELGGRYGSVSDGWAAHGKLGFAVAKFSAAYTGSHQESDDYRFGGGTVADTAFQTTQHGLLLSLLTPAGQWSADLGLTRTRDAGTPALPMDLIEDDGYKTGLRYKGELSFGAVEGRFYYHEIDHLMDNFSLRPPGMMPMASEAGSRDIGASVGAVLPRERHTLRLGAETHLNTLDAVQQNMMSWMRQDTFRDATRDRVGCYAEWQADWTGQWRTLLGMRVDGVMADAGAIAQFYPASAADAAAFNASDRDRTDVNVDVTATVRLAPAEFCALELGFARKNRAPSTLERYLWTPLSASAGQADGRTYLGNLNLDSETSHQVAGAVALHGARWEFKIMPFYNFVSDYIQGAPIARLDGAGLPVLQYQNVSRADLYGVGAAARCAFTDWLALAGKLSYVRGKNRDSGDNLYRIAPLNGSVRLEHKWKDWQSEAEIVLAARQDEVAGYNNEPPTAGFAVLNLRTSCRLTGRLTAQLAVENVLDEEYADHLGGINRVAGSDVPVGERLPSPGRSFVLALRCDF